MDYGHGLWTISETIIFIMSLLGLSGAEIHHTSCPCTACNYVVTTPILSQTSDVGQPNCLHTLLKMLPPNFPMTLEQTVLVGREGTELLSCSNHSRDETRVRII